MASIDYRGMSVLRLSKSVEVTKALATRSWYPNIVNEAHECAGSWIDEDESLEDWQEGFFTSSLHRFVACIYLKRMVKLDWICIFLYLKGMEAWWNFTVFCGCCWRTELYKSCGFIAQPPLSRQIQNLESELNCLSAEAVLYRQHQPDISACP